MGVQLQQLKCQPFPVSADLLEKAGSGGCTGGQRLPSRRRAYIPLACNASYHSPAALWFILPLSYTVNTLAVQKPPAGLTEPVRAPGPLHLMTHPETQPALTTLQAVRPMLNAGWPVLFVVLGALRTLGRAADLVPHCPRDVFLSAPGPPQGLHSTNHNALLPPCLT